MNRLLCCLLLLFPMLAAADIADLLKGEVDVHKVIADGKTYVIFTTNPTATVTLELFGNDCWVLSTDDMATIPDTKTDVIAQIQNTMRPLTDVEKTLCFGQSTSTPPATDTGTTTPPATTASNLKTTQTSVYSNTSPYPGQPIGSGTLTPVGTPCSEPHYDYNGKTYYTVTFADTSGHSHTGIALCQ